MVVDVLVTISPIPGTTIYFVGEVDSPGDHANAWEDLTDPFLALQYFRKPQYVDKDGTVINTSVVPFRVPSGNRSSLFKFVGWALAFCLMAVDTGTVPEFAYMLIDIPADSAAHRFPPCCGVRTNAFPRDPRMTQERYDWLYSVELAVCDKVHTEISHDDFVLLQLRVTQSRFRSDSGNVYWKYAIQPWMAVNSTSYMSFIKSDKFGNRGRLHTACRLPFRFRFPQVEVPMTPTTPHGLTMNSLHAMVTRYREEPTLTPAKKRRFDVVTQFMAQQPTFFGRQRRA